MAKASGPLHSVGASGSIAGELTFSKRSSGQQVRFQRKQKDVLTPGREAQREQYSAAVATWNELPASMKGVLAGLNPSAGQSTYNFFVHLFLTGPWPGPGPSIYGEREHGVLEYGREI